MTYNKELHEALPELDVSGLKEIDTCELRSIDEILPPGEMIECVCPACGSTFRAYPASTRVWCSDRCGWRVRKRRERDR